MRSSGKALNARIITLDGIILLVAPLPATFHRNTIFLPSPMLVFVDVAMSVVPMPVASMWLSSHRR